MALWRSPNAIFDPVLKETERGRVILRSQAIRHSFEARHRFNGRNFVLNFTTNFTERDKTVTSLPLRTSRCSYLVEGDTTRKTSKSAYGYPCWATWP